MEELVNEFIGIDPLSKGILHFSQLQKAHTQMFSFNCAATSTTHIYGGTTGNCQLNVVANAEGTLAYWNYTSHDGKNTPEKYKKNIRLGWATILNLLGKPLLLFDIKNTHVAALTELFGEKNIVMSTPYASSNGSKMNIVIVNTFQLAQWARSHKIKIPTIPPKI